MKRFLPTIVLTVLVIGSLACSTASPSFSGTWSGTLSQTEGGISPSYNYSMTMIQNGDQVSGTATIEDGDLNGMLKFEGVVSGSKLTFSDSEVISSNLPSGLEWCLKSGTLTLSGNDLSGEWTGYNSGGACSPGIMSLTRE